jgi:patatin-like phospholipase/acyl hydrolase
MAAVVPKKLFRVLALDGGGAKGFYTLGALKEIEGMIGCPLYQRFDLVFGTSTGAIIAALVCLGKSVDEIVALYRNHVIKVMAALLPSSKSAALESPVSGSTTSRA